MNGSNKKRRRVAVNEYAVKTVSYLIIMLTVTVAAVFVLINPVTELVHKIESYVPMEVRDIVPDDSTYNSSSIEESNPTVYNYGAKIGVITSDDFGLNSSIYCGANRTSMSEGVGFHRNSGPIGGNDTTVITGYTEAGFSALEYAQKGDVLHISTSQGSFSYIIKDMQYLNNADSSYQNSGNALVLCGICSAFSQHSGEKLIVFADKADREVQ